METTREDLIRIVKEMNEADYSMNVMLFQAHEELLESEITAKQTILLEHVHKHNQMTVSELAERMNVSSSAVSQIVSKLEKANYVTREINRSNRREILVRLAQRGTDYFVKQDHLERTIIERYYSQLDFDEVVAMKNTILKLKAIVEKEVNGDGSKTIK
ncbi:MULTISPECIES: MarR family winged helix-turn-helix transcriptional regulator [Paenibacillus]|jgi:DNA-binding MarR family transcriptional regulator|uniref:MarR family transcriptional regulator n=1 Tax=Paenibacillus oceani TaxID=2772510 RepID=A0A927GZS0_9BACL|nr:MarR family transcriptional regulator [Paenibacillus oceani]MBD2862940.1 MarR family transcriptional regulator [Paenibacillus oceani]MDF2661280.1 transcriptional regulator [Paenibacillus sp.]